MSSSISGEHRDGPDGTIPASAQEGTDPGALGRSTDPTPRSAPQGPVGPLGPTEPHAAEATHAGKSAQFAHWRARPQAPLDAAEMEDKARAALGGTFDPAETSAKLAEFTKLPPDQRKAAFDKWIDNRMFVLAPDEHPIYEKYGLKLLGRGGSQIVYSNDKRPDTAIKANFGDIRWLILHNAQFAGRRLNHVPPRLRQGRQSLVRAQRTEGRGATVLRSACASRRRHIFARESALAGVRLSSRAPLRSRLAASNAKDTRQRCPARPLRKADEDPQFHANLREFVVLAADYTNKTGRALDILGGDNVLLARNDEGDWDYRLVDAEYPTPAPTVTAAAWSLRTFCELPSNKKAPPDRIAGGELWNGLNYARTINGLLDYFGLPHKAITAFAAIASRTRISWPEILPLVRNGLACNRTQYPDLVKAYLEPSYLTPSLALARKLRSRRLAA